MEASRPAFVPGSPISVQVTEFRRYFAYYVEQVIHHDAVIYLQKRGRAVAKVHSLPLTPEDKIFAKTPVKSKKKSDGHRTEKGDGTGAL